MGPSLLIKGGQGGESAVGGGGEGDFLPFISPKLIGLLEGLLWRIIIVPLLELPISEDTLVIDWNLT